MPREPFTGTFESKEDLFAEIFRLATQREVDKVAEALASEGNAVSERLEVAPRQFAERALKGPVMAWSLIAEPVDPKVEEERLAYRRAYAQPVRDKRSGTALKKAASRIRTPARAVPAWSVPSPKAWLALCPQHRPASHRSSARDQRQ